MYSLQCIVYTEGRSVSAGHVKIKPKSGQKLARTSTQFRGACFTNGSNSHTASWWLHFTFFCSDNAGSLSKVLTTEEEIHKEKENSAANIYSGIDVKHRTFSWKQVKIHRWKNLLHITIEYRWETVKDIAASSNYTNSIEQEHWRSN